MVKKLKEGRVYRVLNYMAIRVFTVIETVHLTLPPHIISAQVKSRSMLHHGSVGASLKQNKRNLTLTLTLSLLLPSIVFHNKICLYYNFYDIFIFTAYSRLIYYMRRQCQLNSMYYMPFTLTFN